MGLRSNPIAVTIPFPTHLRCSDFFHHGAKVLHPNKSWILAYRSRSCCIHWTPAWADIHLFRPRADLGYCTIVCYVFHYYPLDDQSRDILDRDTTEDHMD